MRVRGAGGAGGRVLVEVYTREHCGLCEHAEQLVAAEAGDARVRHIDIDADPELRVRYHVRVPVVVVDGREVAEGRVAGGAVRRAVDRARARRRLPWRRT